ncbi:DNA cytosine methyltransferase, partial [Staphylococcus aureus]|nr:DNA cytosine methyltransferase [Staphylococcus aureus]
PQNRERIYIVGFDKQQIKNAENFSFPEPLPIETSLGSILESNVNDKYTISDRLWYGHQRRKREHKAKGNGFGYSIFNETSPYTNT